MPNAVATFVATLVARVRYEQAGEGVISTAIAVLIMAVIGGVMWIAFDGIFRDAEQRVSTEISQIGGS